MQRIGHISTVLVMLCVTASTPQYSACIHPQCSTTKLLDRDPSASAFSNNEMPVPSRKPLSLPCSFLNTNSFHSNVSSRHAQQRVIEKSTRRQWELDRGRNSDDFCQEPVQRCWRNRKSDWQSASSRTDRRICRDTRDCTESNPANIPRA